MPEGAPPSLELIEELVEARRGDQKDRANSMDTRAAAVLAFAGGLISFRPDSVWPIRVHAGGIPAHTTALRQRVFGRPDVTHAAAQHCPSG